MKHMKRVISLVLAMMMLSACIVFAQAAGEKQLIFIDGYSGKNSTISQEAITPGVDIVYPKLERQENYVFYGWNDENNTLFKETKMPDRDLTLTSVWVPDNIEFWKLVGELSKDAVSTISKETGMSQEQLELVMKLANMKIMLYINDEKAETSLNTILETTHSLYTKANVKPNTFFTFKMAFEGAGEVEPMETIAYSSNTYKVTLLSNEGRFNATEKDGLESFQTTLSLISYGNESLEDLIKYYDVKVSKPDAEFLGWSRKADVLPLDDDTVIKNDEMFYAIYSDTNAHTCKHEDTIVEGKIEATLEKEGYSGDTICRICGKVVSSGHITEKLTKNDFHTVTFMSDDQVLKTEKVQDGKNATAPKTPEKTGYTFKGWDQSFENVTKDLTVKAVWEKKAEPTTVNPQQPTTKKQATIISRSDSTTPTKQEPTTAVTPIPKTGSSIGKISIGCVLFLLSCAGTALYTQKRKPDNE